jgi:hypothetical protein
LPQVAESATLLAAVVLMVRDDEPDWYGMGLAAAAILGWVLNDRDQKLFERKVFHRMLPDIRLHF